MKSLSSRFSIGPSPASVRRPALLCESLWHPFPGRACPLRRDEHTTGQIEDQGDCHHHERAEKLRSGGHQKDDAQQQDGQGLIEHGGEHEEDTGLLHCQAIVDGRIDAGHKAAVIAGKKGDDAQALPGT